MVQALPKWVLGGEFGDISNLLNNREQEYEATRQIEALNDIRDIDLEEKQRRAELEREMRTRGIFGGEGQGPVTLRDMYGRVRDTAMELGSYEDVIQMQEKIDSLERQRQQDDMDRRTKESMIEARQRVGSRGGGPTKPTIRLENAQTGEKGVYTPEQANEKLATGDWDFASSSLSFEDLQRMAQQGQTKPEALSLGSREKPGERESEKQVKLTEEIRTSAGIGRISSGEVAPKDIKIRYPRSGAIKIIRKGEVIP
jgi:hypothetical protein